MRLKKGDKVQVYLKELSHDETVEADDILPYADKTGIIMAVPVDDAAYDGDASINVNFADDYPEDETQSNDFFLRELKKINPEIDENGNLE